MGKTPYREEDFQAAVMDLKTGKIYTDYGHPAAREKAAVDGVEFNGENPQGFLRVADSKFMTMDETENEYGFRTSEQLHGIELKF
jgi:hypothetical protein